MRRERKGRKGRGRGRGRGREVRASWRGMEWEGRGLLAEGRTHKTAQVLCSISRKRILAGDGWVEVLGLPVLAGIVVLLALETVDRSVSDVLAMCCCECCMSLTGREGCDQRKG